ncbi:MAG: tRNA (adenosine(37)-N6)-threonylcarbamoyltransferase complex ATPase subunit type 1 TsaE [Negativicutes bacterium]|nr:tRNA (adenosine(37)-N6)-threonylcarbamoyltransferase complex ATPase subunit type 1 TsaE [Negativicutes bacterium]
MLAVTTNTPDATHAFGRTLAARLSPGDVIFLTGDLGAGKTLLVQGIAAGLGFGERVTSPTFTIMHIYEGGRLTVYHFDLYRLDRPEQLDDIGFEEYKNPDGVAVIEWADKFTAEMPDAGLWITLKPGPDAAERVITLEPKGARYVALCEELKQVADSSFRHGHAGI